MSKEKPYQCLTCEIQLNSQVQFDTHVAGKAHMKKLKKALEDATTGGDRMVGQAKISADASTTKVQPTGYDYEQPLSCSNPSLRDPRLVQGTKRKLGLSNYPCPVCDLEFNSDFQAQQHFSGTKHAKKLKNLEQQNLAFREEYGLPPPKTPVTTQTPKKQKAPLTEGFYCSFCDIYLNSLEQLTAHRTGNKHLAKLQKVKEEGQGETSTTTESYSCSMCNVSLSGMANYNKHKSSKAHQDAEMAQTLDNTDGGYSAPYTGEEDGGPGDFPPQENVWAFTANTTVTADSYQQYPTS